MDKKIAFVGMTIGSLVGGYIPALWGESSFSPLSLILGLVGAVLGYLLFLKFLT